MKNVDMSLAIRCNEIVENDKLTQLLIDNLDCSAKRYTKDLDEEVHHLCGAGLLGVTTAIVMIMIALLFV